jgi:DNA-binding NtrC family response regulator
MATVAIFNSSDDTVSALRLAFEHHGYETVSGHIDEIKHGALDFVEFVKTHDPKAVVYDIAPPYDHNWTFLKLLRTTEVMRDRQVVVTTTHKANLERLVGPTEALEIIGKPYDLEQVVLAAIRALDAR